MLRSSRVRSVLKKKDKFMNFEDVRIINVRVVYVVHMDPFRYVCVPFQKKKYLRRVTSLRLALLEGLALLDWT
jgi:hypothetical protein